MRSREAVTVAFGLDQHPILTSPTVAYIDEMISPVCVLVYAESCKKHIRRS